MLNKLEQFLFYFLFFAIPFQTREILYYSGWYFNEWQSISVYATDVLLIILFLFWGFSSIRGSKFLISNFKFLIKSRFSISKTFLEPDFYLVLFLVVAAISVKNSSDFFVGAFLWLKLVEFSLFYFYLKNYAIKKFDFIKILYALIIGGVFQVVIAIGQFLKQGDLGLRWLGESVLGPHMTGVASFLVPSNVEGFVDSGEKIIRAYGTTPHSNILAAYLFLGIFAFYFVFLYKRHFHTYILMCGYALFLVGLFFTFSRTIIFLWAAGFLIRGLLIVAKSRFKRQFWRDTVFKTKLTQILVVTFLTVVVFSLVYWPEVQSRMTLSSEEEAVQLRVFYNEESLKGGINLFGIGLGDFTGWLMEQNPNLPRHIYQPVHNVYLLIYSEVGVIGFILFLLFLAGLLYEFIKKTRLRELKHYSFLLVVISVLFIGLFDHFLLTIQQGRFVFWLGLALLTIINNRDKVEV